MARKGVVLSVASDTGQVEQGIKNGVIEPLEDAIDVIKDLAKEGDKSGEKLEDAMRDAQKDTERLAGEYEQLGKTIRDSSKKSGQGFKDNTSDATSAASRDLGELKDEAVQNASETFSSFDGSVDSFVDGLQGTFGGIVSNMGPMGAVIGGALALGIGAGVAKGEELAEAINTAKERATELAAELIDVDGDLSQIQWAEKIQEWGLAIEDSREWWEFWQTDAKTAMEVAEEAAERTGIALKDMVLGMSGTDAQAATRIVGELTDQIKELEAQRKVADGNSARESINSEIRDRQNLIDKLKEQGGVTEEAAALQQRLTEYTDEAAAADRAAAAATEARTDAANSLQSALDESVASWTAYVDAESGAVDPSAYLQGMQDRMNATANFNTNVQSLATEFGLSQEEIQAILDQGVEFGPMLQSIMDSGLAPTFIAQMQAAVGGGQEIIDGTPLGATVTADADTAAAVAGLDAAATDRTSDVTAKASTATAEKDLAAVAEKKRTATITAKADTTAANRDLDSVASKSRSASITAGVDLTEATRALNNWINTPRTTTVTVNTVDRTGKPVP